MITHAAVGLSLGYVFAAKEMPPLYWGLSAGLGVLPDIDVVSFKLGIPYESPLGHRGFSHSLCCALVVTLPLAVLTAPVFAVSWLALWGMYFVMMATHAILDTFTNGGGGVALFAPFTWKRYFSPWRPVQVSPVGFGFFSKWGLHALLSEVVWIWTPGAAMLAAVVLYRFTVFA